MGLVSQRQRVFGCRLWKRAWDLGSCGAGQRAAACKRVFLDQRCKRSGAAGSHRRRLLALQNHSVIEPALSRPTTHTSSEWKHCAGLHLTDLHTCSQTHHMCVCAWAWVCVCVYEHEWVCVALTCFCSDLCESCPLYISPLYKRPEHPQTHSIPPSLPSHTALKHRYLYISLHNTNFIKQHYRNS